MALNQSNIILYMLTKPRNVTPARVFSRAEILLFIVAFKVARNFFHPLPVYFSE